MHKKWKLYGKPSPITVRTKLHVFLERLSDPDGKDAQENRDAWVENQLKRPTPFDDGVNEYNDAKRNSNASVDQPDTNYFWVRLKINIFIILQNYRLLAVMIW